MAADYGAAHAVHGLAGPRRGGLAGGGTGGGTAPTRGQGGAWAKMRWDDGCRRLQMDSLSPFRNTIPCPSIIPVGHFPFFPPRNYGTVLPTIEKWPQPPDRQRLTLACSNLRTTSMLSLTNDRKPWAAEARLQQCLL